MSTLEQKEFFRRAILKVLDTNRGRWGLPEASIAMHLEVFGFTATAEEVLDELDYLLRRGLVEEVRKDISRENRAWRITQAGLACLDARGL
jgi:hypothetical protein